MTILSTKGAENIEKALESIKEKDLKSAECRML
jgi:chemotaxis protein MotB